MADNECPAMVLDLVIPKNGNPTCNGGLFPFLILEDSIIVEPQGLGFSKVTMTLLAKGVTIEGE